MEMPRLINLGKPQRLMRPLSPRNRRHSGRCSLRLDNSEVGPWSTCLGLTNRRDLVRGATYSGVPSPQSQMSVRHCGADSLTRIDDPSTPQAVTLVYEPNTGRLSLDTGGERLTVLEIQSQAGNLTGAADTYIFPGIDCGFGGGTFNPNGSLSCAQGGPNKWGAVGIHGFANLDLERIAQRNLSADELINDLDVMAAFVGGGGAGKFVHSSPHQFIVPELSSAVRLLFWILVLVANGMRIRNLRLADSFAGSF